MEAGDTAVDRETLYNEVWSEPVTLVAPRYGLSDVGLAKICRALAIPLPSRGYWAKVKAGKIMGRAPLPKLQAPAVRQRLIKLSPQKAEEKQVMRETAARVRKETPAPSPPEESTPHPLVMATSKRLRRREGWAEGELLRSAPKEVLNLSVAKGSLDRAVAITDLLVKELVKRGFGFEIIAEKGVTELKWLETGTKLEFCLTEQVSRSPHVRTPAEERAHTRYWNQRGWERSLQAPRIPDYDYTPTGVLKIEVGRYPSKSWKDTARKQLESRLGEVVSGILVLAQEKHTREQEQARREEARRQAIARYEYRKKRREDEAGRFEALETNARNWERASSLRAFADATERHARGEGELTAEQVEWLAWVRAKADWLDPLKLVSDPILDAPVPKFPGYW